MAKLEAQITKKHHWSSARMKQLLGDSDEEVKQTFELYDNIGKMLTKFCMDAESSEEGALNLTCLATAMGMCLNDICQELEDEGATDCREHVSGVVSKFVFLNKRLAAH